MSDADPNPTEAGPTPAEPESPADPVEPSGDRRLADGDATTYLYWGVLGALGLLALVALFRFYNSASRAITLWVAPRFEPVLLAGFNLAVVLAAAIGISLVVRELNG